MVKGCGEGRGLRRFPGFRAEGGTEDRVQPDTTLGCRVWGLG